MTERKGLISFRTREMTIIGDDLKPGDKAPEFEVLNQEWNIVQGLESAPGKVRIIGSLPSLETSVCDVETRRFNQEASKLSADVAILMVSADLPYTQARWCGAAGIDRVSVLSDSLKKDFGTKYGVLMKEIGILRRAIFVVDRHGTIQYAAYMPAIGVEPDYEAVLAAARKLI